MNPDEKDEKDDDKPGLDIDEGVAEIAADLGLGEEEGEDDDTEGGETDDTTVAAAGDKGKKDDKSAGAPAAAAKPGAKPDDKGGTPAVAKPGETAAAPADDKGAKPDIPSALPDGSPQELRTWRPEARELLKKLPPEFKPVVDEILKRERDIDKGLKEAQTGVAVANEFREMLKPYAPTYQKYSINPVKHIDQLLRAQMTLYFGTPEQKVAILRRAAQDFGVPFDQLAAEAPAMEDNPAVTGLSKQLESVTSTVKQMQEGQRLEREAAFKRDLEAFAADPAHPYFDEVSERVLQLLQSRVCGTLQEAYDQAAWTNPVVRAKLQAAEQEKATKAAETKRKEEEDARARATAANVRARPKSRSAAAPTGTMDDTMAEVMADIKGRA